MIIQYRHFYPVIGLGYMVLGAGIFGDLILILGVTIRFRIDSQLETDSAAPLVLMKPIVINNSEQVQGL